VCDGRKETFVLCRGNVLKIFPTPGTHQEKEIQDAGAELSCQVDHGGHFVDIPGRDTRVDRKIQSCGGEDFGGPYCAFPRPG
jgi:hypothetical protein